MEITVTAFLDGFEEPGRRGDKGRGVFVDGWKIDDDVPGPVPPASPASSNDLRRGVVFFSLSEPADKEGGSGGDGGDGGGGRNTVVAEACVPLILRTDEDESAAMTEAAEHAPVQPGVVDDNSSRAGNRYRNRRRTTGESVWPVRAKMKVTDPSLWWPRGMGRSGQQQQQQQRQPLYTLRVDWYPGTDASCPLLGGAVPVSGSDAVVAAADSMAVKAGTTTAAAARRPGAGSESLGAATAAGVAVGDGADGKSDARDSVSVNVGVASAAASGSADGKSGADGAAGASVGAASAAAADATTSDSAGNQTRIMLLVRALGLCWC